MKISKFVFDPDLFKKMSSEYLPFSDTKTYADYKHGIGEFDGYDVLECDYFYDILTAVDKKVCMLALNEEITSSYIPIVKNCPHDIKIKFWHILSEEKCCEFIEDKWCTQNEKLFLGTSLESKIPYLTVAHFLHDNKLIVSTKKSIETVYLNHFEDLCKIKVICKDAHDVKDEIFNDLIDHYNKTKEYTLILNGVDELISSMRFDISRIKINISSVNSGISDIKTEMKKQSEIESLNKLSIEKLSHVQPDQLICIKNELLGRLDGIEILLKDIPNTEEIGRMLNRINELKKQKSDPLQIPSEVFTLIGFIITVAQAIIAYPS